MLLTVGAFAVIPYMPSYLVANVGVLEGQLSWMYILGGGLSLFASPLIGKQADRFGTFRVYRIMAPLSAAVIRRHLSPAGSAGRGDRGGVVDFCVQRRPDAAGDDDDHLVC